MKQLHTAVVGVAGFINLAIFICMVLYYGREQVKYGLIPLAVVSLLLGLYSLTLFVPVLRKSRAAGLWICAGLSGSEIIYCIYRLYHWAGARGDDGPWFFCSSVVLPLIILSVSGYISAALRGH